MSSEASPARARMGIRRRPARLGGRVCRRVGGADHVGQEGRIRGVSRDQSRQVARHAGPAPGQRGPGSRQARRRGGRGLDDRDASTAAARWRRRRTRLPRIASPSTWHSGASTSMIWPPTSARRDSRTRVRGGQRLGQHRAARPADRRARHADGRGGARARCAAGAGGDLLQDRPRAGDGGWTRSRARAGGKRASSLPRHEAARHREHGGACDPQCRRDWRHVPHRARARYQDAARRGGRAGSAPVSKVLGRDRAYQPRRGRSPRSRASTPRPPISSCAAPASRATPGATAWWPRATRPPACAPSSGRTWRS